MHGAVPTRNKRLIYREDFVRSQWPSFAVYFTAIRATAFFLSAFQKSKLRLSHLQIGKQTAMQFDVMLVA
jgi:hypothetical protein